VLLGWDLAFRGSRSLASTGQKCCACAPTGPSNRPRRGSPTLKNGEPLSGPRALENAFFVAASNRIGEEYSYHFFGQSLIVGPRFEIYASMDEETEGYAVARIDLDVVRRTRESSSSSSAACRRPTGPSCAKY